MYSVKCSGIQYYESIVLEKFDVKVVFHNHKPEYLFIDKQTGSSVSCAYDFEDYNETIMELVGLC